MRSRATRIAALGVLVLATAAPPGAAQQSIGAGSYATVLPAGRSGPSDTAGRPLRPSIGGAVPGVVPTNDWWSSLVFERAGSHSAVLHPHPLSVEAHADGIALGHADRAAVTAREFRFPFVEDLRVGVPGLAAPRTVVENWSDWTVTTSLDDGARRLEVILGHGLPCAQFRARGGPAEVRFAAAVRVVVDRGPMLIVESRGRTWGLFAPSGALWTRRGPGFESFLALRDYFTVAILPDANQATIDLFAAHAHVEPVDTRVDWTYDPATARVRTTFEMVTAPREGAEQRALMALYPHQWRHSQTPWTGLEYPSARGRMRLVRGNTFVTEVDFVGVLPGLPTVATPASGFDRILLERELEAVAAQPPAALIPAGRDTYWTGKALWRTAALVDLAHQLRRENLRDRLLLALRITLEDWLTAAVGETSNLFYHDPDWGTLIGYPAGFGSDTELNDHDFHYGYFVRAAAVVARFDPAWADRSRWGGMVELLIRDVASPRRDDPMFPFLRSFDPYAGHSWASGHAWFRSGNNEESSSEAQNFASAVIFWGAATGDTGLRDLGVYLLATTATAIDEYWFDRHGESFPTGYAQPSLGILWGDGGAYATWWTANPEEIHGIQFLPLHAGSLYLGIDPGYVLRNQAGMVLRNGGPAQEWRGIHWKHLAFADPAAAIGLWDRSPGYGPEAGETRAHTYHWLHAFAELGTVHPTVRGSLPTSAAFDRAGRVTHVAFNPTGVQRAVRFTDGAVLSVPPNALATDAGHALPPDPTEPATGPLGHVTATVPLVRRLDAALWADTPVAHRAPLTLRLQTVAGNAPLILVVDASLGPIPIGPYGYSALGWSASSFAIPGSTGHDGRWSFSHPLLSEPFAGGRHLEAWILDPAARNGFVRRSNALTMRTR